MSFFQLDQADLGVDLRRLEAGVAELLLHVADVGPVLFASLSTKVSVLQHVGSARVVEQVATSRLLDSRLQGHFPNQSRQVFQTPRPALVVEKPDRVKHRKSNAQVNMKLGKKIVST